MKIIKPILDLESYSTSDAPADQISTWQPVGRDLLNYINKPIFDVYQNTLYAVSSTDGGNIYKVDLTSGDVFLVATVSTFFVRNISISPDGSLLYLATLISSSLSRHVVIDASNGVKRLEHDQAEYAAGIHLMPISNNAWHLSSDACFFVAGDGVYRINLTAWSVTRIFPFSDNDDGICLVSNGSKLFFYLKDGSFGNNKWGRYDIAGASADGNTAYSPANSGFNLMYAMTHNSVTGEVLALTDSGVKVFPSSGTLLLDPSPTTFPENLLLNAKMFKTTATHLITRSLSSSPYWNYRLLTDYSLDKSLPTLPAPGEGIAVGTDYTVVQQPSGIALLNNADDSIVSQQNPNVTLGDNFIYGDKVYEALVDNNDQPDEGAEADPQTWLDKGFVNPLRMFDSKLDSLTTASGDLTIELTAGAIVSGLALFNVDAASIQVTMTDPTDGLVFDTGEVAMLDNSTVNNWFSFFFSPYVKKKDYANLELPPYPDATITISLNGGGSGTAIGEVVAGTVFRVGESQYNTSVGILDYSRKEQDQFGNFNIIKRRFSKRADYDIKIMTSAASGVQRTLADLRAEPIVFIGDTMKEETIIYGYYRSFDIVISSPSISDATITVEGL